MTETRNCTELRNKLDEFTALGSPQYERFRELDQLIKQRATLERRFGRLLAVLLHCAEMHVENLLAPDERSPQLLGALNLVSELYAERGALRPDTLAAVRDLRERLSS